MDNIAKAWREAKEFVVEYFPQYRNEVDLADAVVVDSPFDGNDIPYTPIIKGLRIVVLPPSIEDFEEALTLDQVLIRYPKLWESLKRSVYQELGLQVEDSEIIDISRNLFANYANREILRILFHELVHIIDKIDIEKKTQFSDFNVRIARVIARKNGFEIFIQDGAEINPQFRKSYYSIYVFLSKVLYPIEVRIYVSKGIENFLREICGLEYFGDGMETIFVEERFGIKRDKYLKYFLMGFLYRGLHDTYIPISSMNVSMLSERELYTVGKSLRNATIREVINLLPHFISIVYLMKGPFDPSVREKRFEERIPKSFFDEYSHKYFNILKKTIDKFLQKS
ncbi:MAG: hypothetical protein BXU00_01555 [Candidatus Nanoclepta minutus]|uniref:Uncharacterized protein n=1 Tax=Candidatus Nanoclepta minutus TaxID=1940235 RepID=A0A397WQT0_9ARCH|nr:MAG: hypothetical protein BXU00_01555 [Candidatus Nanoclepta minutus]